MSEQDKIYRLPDALERKGVEIKCPICSSDQFAVNPGLKEYIIPAMDKNDNYKENYAQGTPIYSMVCINCSYVLNFSVPLADVIVDSYDADK